MRKGSSDVHRNLPLHKGVLLAGPRGSGKEMLVHIVCNALGALLLDLSPANLTKSFNTGKSFFKTCSFSLTNELFGDVIKSESRSVYISKLEGKYSRTYLAVDLISPCFVIVWRERNDLAKLIIN